MQFKKVKTTFFAVALYLPVALRVSHLVVLGLVSFEESNQVVEDYKVQLDDGVERLRLKSKLD